MGEYSALACNDTRLVIHNGTVIHNDYDRVRQIFQVIYLYGDSSRSPFVVRRGNNIIYGEIVFEIVCRSLYGGCGYRAFVYHIFGICVKQHADHRHKHYNRHDDMEIHWRGDF